MTSRRVFALATFLGLAACGAQPLGGAAPASEPLAAPAPAPAPAPGAGPSRHPCTMRACHDGASITATFDAAQAPLGEHTFAVTTGGRTLTCTVDVTQADDTAFGRCTGDAEVSVGTVSRTVEVATNVPGTVGVAFERVPGRFQFRLTLGSTEPDVHVVYRAGGRVLLDRRASLTYAEERPNGEGCDPVCQRAELRWDEGTATP